MNRYLHANLEEKDSIKLSQFYMSSCLTFEQDIFHRIVKEAGVWAHTWGMTSSRDEDLIQWDFCLTELSLRLLTRDITDWLKLKYTYHRCYKRLQGLPNMLFC